MLMIERVSLLQNRKKANAKSFICPLPLESKGPEEREVLWADPF
jgi:hypothetical protein